MLTHRIRRWLRRALVAGLAAALLAAVALLAATLWARHRLERAVERITAAGDTLELVDLVPHLDPGERNGSDTLNALHFLLQDAHRNAAAEPPWGLEDGTLDAALEGSEEAVAELEAGLRRPVPRLALELLDRAREVERASFLASESPQQEGSDVVRDVPLALRVEMLRPLRWLAARAAVASARGRSAEAYRDVALIFRVSRWLEEESPTILGHVLGLGVGRRGYRALEAFLLRSPPPAVAAADCAAELDALHASGPGGGLAGERAYGYQLLRSMAEGSDAGWIQGGGWRPWPQVYDLALTATYLEAVTDLVELARQPADSRPPVESVLGSIPAWAPVRMLIPSLADSLATTDVSFEQRDLARIALAYVAFRAREGRPPGDLDELVPVWLPELPADRFDGAALRYLKDDAGCRAYSIGPDRKDDGGRLRWDPRSGRGDVVWRLPCGG